MEKRKPKQKPLPDMLGFHSSPIPMAKKSYKTVLLPLNKSSMQTYATVRNETRLAFYIEIMKKKQTNQGSE